MSNEHTYTTMISQSRVLAKDLLELFPSGNRSEVVAAILVMAIVISMILPLPLWLLDLLIAFNISIACLLAVLVIQLKETVHLTTFPALLLITTLFRVSINVASTRQILLEGSAGHIIEAFGEVVVGGNIVVGLVVFTILTLIQFLVITKGSERVAEVGARFTLDAMPGKQLAIDIELKSGNITTEEAQNKRAQLGTESQFFGAMDGALKFVKGDAIAGILITLTNLIGGIVIGITQKNMSAGDAAKLYSVLSIGDALVAQIPALLTSITAGLLITRISGASESTSGNVGSQISRQLTSYPKSWMTASVPMLVFGLVPGMPSLIFIVLSTAAFSFGFYVLLLKKKSIEKMNSRENDDFEEKREFSPISPFLLRFNSLNLDKNSYLEVLRLARRTRNRLVMQYGLVPPAIETASVEMTTGADIEFCHNEVATLCLDLPQGNLIVECSVEQLGKFSRAPIKTEDHRLFPGKKVAWFAPDMQDEIRAMGYKLIVDWAYVEKRIEDALFRLGPQHFGIEQASKLMKWLSCGHPELGKELERAMPLPRLADVLQRLLLERVSIRNVNQIAETLADWGQRERDPAILAECVRNTLSREIFGAYAASFLLSSILIDPSVEEKIRSSIRQTAFGDYIELDEEHIELIFDNLLDLLKEEQNDAAVVILAPQDIRPQFSGLIRARFDHIPVLAISDVPPDFKVKVIGVLGNDIGDAEDAEPIEYSSDMV